MLKTIAVFAFVALLSGCASIVSGVNQPLSVETRLNGDPVVGAACKLSSNKGTWFVTTPGSLTVHRGFQDLNVECSKAGMTSSVDLVPSRVRALYFGNILFGGVIGLIVDGGDGAGFDYPDLIAIDMGRNGNRAAPSAEVGSVPPVAPAAPAMTPTAPTPAAPTPAAVPTPSSTREAPSIARAAAPAPAASNRSVDPSSSPPVPAAALVATATSGASRMPPPRRELRYQVSAERFARDQQCAATPAAAFLTAGPGSETYSVPCGAGEALIVRCEFGNCRALR